MVKERVREIEYSSNQGRRKRNNIDIASDVN